MRRWLGAITIVLMGGLGLWWRAHATTAESVAGIALPPGFMVKTVVSGLRLPTDLALLPSGDLLITEKGSGNGAAGRARVRLVRQGVLMTQPVIEIGSSVQVDSGLVSIVLDPDFAENGFFYLWYATGETSLGWSGQAVNRLARFTYDPATGTADPASEVIILDNVPWDPIHNGGGLRFAADGTLFIATGDTATPLDPARNIAQNYRSLGGKVLRIRPAPAGGYTVPPDNPYADGKTRIKDVVPLPEIYAAGLRNPFRMFQRQADQALFLVDVGLNTWEEVNRIAPGVNYGWPIREGPCPIHKKGDECTPTPAEYTDPVLAYPLPEGGGSIVGAAFYEGDVFPERYRDKLYFADFNNQLLFVADLTQEPVSYALFATETGYIVDIEAVQDGLYLVDLVEGRIRFLYHDGMRNQVPVPRFSASPRLGAPPLTVTFSALGSYDPDDLTLSYRWHFGDDSPPITTTTPTITHTYTTEGNFLATLQVVDGRGGESETLAQEITVYGGAMPTIRQETLTQPGRMNFQGGDEIRFVAARPGDLDGLDPETPYRWDIDLHHNDHTHPVVSDYVAADVTLHIPVQSHALESSIWYRVHLTMLSETGVRVRVSHDVLPQLVPIQVASWPGVATITINQLPQPPHTPIQLIVGQSYELDTPERIMFERRIGQFNTWVVADGWPTQTGAANLELLEQRNVTVIIGPRPKIYVAYYDDVGPVHAAILPAIYAMPDQ